MTVLKEYDNKNVGKFLSIPTKTYENGDVLDALYFSRYMRRLLSSSIEEMRSSEHYKNTMNKWTSMLSDVDVNDFNSVESKLKLNINVFDPLKTEMQMQGGRVAKESYKTVELLKVGKDKYKPMLKVTGGAAFFQKIPGFGRMNPQSNKVKPPSRPMITVQEPQSVGRKDFSIIPDVLRRKPVRSVQQPVFIEQVSEGPKMDEAMLRVMNSLQSYRKGRKSLMRNYQVDKYYENSMPYLIFYDESEFALELQQGGASPEEAPIDVNEINIEGEVSEGEVPGASDDEANEPVIDVAKDPEMITNIVDAINANKEQFENDVNESPEEVLMTSPDTVPIKNDNGDIIEKEVGEKKVEGITVNNITVTTGGDKMNAKVLKKDGITLCIILQKSAKAVKDIAALTLVNSIRLNLFYMKRNMKERIDKSELQLSSEEYDKIKLYTKTTDIKGIESIKEKKDKDTDLMKDLNELIEALKMRKDAPQTTAPLQPTTPGQQSSEPVPGQQSDSSLDDQLKAKELSLENLKTQVEEKEVELNALDEERRRDVFEKAKIPPSVEIQEDVMALLVNEYGDELPDFVDKIMTKVTSDEKPSIMELIAMYNELEMNDKVLDNDVDFNTIKDDEDVLDLLDLVFDGIIATADDAEDADEEQMLIDSHFKELCLSTYNELTEQNFIGRREEIENETHRLSKEIKKEEKAIKDLNSKIDKLKNPKSPKKSSRRRGGNDGMSEDDIELAIAQILVRLKRYVKFDFDMVSCIYLIIKCIFVVYVMFSIKRDIFPQRSLASKGYKAPTVMTAYQVLENPTGYKANPITLNAMIDAAMDEFDPYFTNTKYDPNTKQIMLAASNEVIANLSDDEFQMIQSGVSNVRDLDAILDQYNNVQLKKNLPQITTYNKTGIEELLMFRETVNAYADLKYKETMQNFYNKAYVTTKDGLVNECTAAMFKDIKFYFTEHVKAMFGTKKGTNDQPIMDYAFMIEHFMRTNQRANNIMSSVVQDLFTNYVGQQSGDEVSKFLKSLKKETDLVDKSVVQRFTLLEEQKKSFVNTPYTKSLKSFFEKPSPQNMMAELISSSAMGDRELTANYFALSLLARILHSGSDYSTKLETTYKGLYSYEQYFGMLGMQCATKTYAEDFNKYFSNIASL